MIDLGAVGARFTILDEASPVLARLMRQLERLDAMIQTTKANFATLIMPPGVNRSMTRMQSNMEKISAASLTTSRAVEASFGKIDAVMANTQRQIGALAGEMKLLGPAVGSVGRVRPGMSAAPGGRPPRPPAGGSATHISGPSVSLPGGSHARFGNNAGMATVGLLGYGVYEEAKMQDAIFQLLYHTGQPGTPANRKNLRDIIQGSMSESGYGLDEITEAAKTEARMFKGTPGDGIDVLPEMLKAATIEARLKGTSVKESMNSLVGLAHMTKQYDPEQIKKLAPAFAFLSASNPASLGSMEKAASYAVPILQSGLEIDPMSSLLLGTVMTRAGATNTKSGTWLRNMMLNAMPGTSVMSKNAYKKHEEALGALGLTDNGKPTWFTDNKPDPFKLLDIASARAGQIPLEKRAAYEKQLFGVQGYGAFALLADPAVREQVTTMKKEMESPAFKNRYATFSDEYAANSPVQKGRKAWADTQNVLMDLGATTLPVVNAGLSGLDSVLKKIKETTGENTGNKIIGGGLFAGALAWWHRAKLPGLAEGAMSALTAGGAGTAAGTIGLLGGGLGIIAASAPDWLKKGLAEGQKAQDALHLPDLNKNAITGPKPAFGSDFGGGKGPFIPQMPEDMKGAAEKAIKPIAPAINGELTKIPGDVTPTVKSSFAKVESAIIGAINSLAAAVSAAAAAIPKVAAPTGEKHADIHLDGHKVGKLVERRVVARNTIPTGTNDFDGRSMMTPVDIG